MAKGWGYRNKRSQEQVFVDSLMKKFESDEMKVYESTKDMLCKGCYLTMRLLFNKNSKKIKLIITGKDMTGQRITPYEKNVSEFKTLVNIKNEILKNAFDEFFNIIFGCDKYSNIVNLADNDFSSLLNKFIDGDMYKMNSQRKEKIWNTFYNDMFDRTATYTNYDIVLIHESYIKACQ